MVTLSPHFEAYDVPQPKYSRQATKILERVEKDLLRPLGEVIGSESSVGEGGSSSTATDWALQESF
jgi:hypothetical protein